MSQLRCAGQLACLALCALLSACGGGGGSASSGADSGSQSAQPAATEQSLLSYAAAHPPQNSASSDNLNAGFVSALNAYALSRLGYDLAQSASGNQDVLALPFLGLGSLSAIWAGASGTSAQALAAGFNEFSDAQTLSHHLNALRASLDSPLLPASRELWALNGKKFATPFLAAILSQQLSMTVLELPYLPDNAQLLITDSQNGSLVWPAAQSVDGQTQIANRRYQTPPAQIQRRREGLHRQPLPKPCAQPARREKPARAHRA